MSGSSSTHVLGQLVTGLQPSIEWHRNPHCATIHQRHPANVVLLPTSKTLQQWHGYGHQVRAPPFALALRTTDGFCIAPQRTDQRPWTNSRPMPRLPRSQAMANLLISPPRRPLATRQTTQLRRVMHTDQRSCQVVSQQRPSSFPA